MRGETYSSGVFGKLKFPHKENFRLIRAAATAAGGMERSLMTNGENRPERRGARFRFIDFHPRATTDRDRTTGSSMRA